MDKLDPRTTHLLPTKKYVYPDYYAYMKLAHATTPANDGAIIKPTEEEIKKISDRSFIGPQLIPKKEDVVSFKPYSKRFGAVLLDKEGKKHFGKIITTLGSAEEWASQNGYTVLKAFQFRGYIDPEKEKTEISE